MLTFWRHGYETTSIVDLTTAMGITAPSLYTAFGDKKRLFLEAACRYAGDPAAMELMMERAPTAHDAARELLTSAAIAYTGETTPPGCLLASATASGSTASCDVQAEIIKIRSSIAGIVRARIQRDIDIGLLPPVTDATALASLIMAVTQGMSVLARDGMDRGSLLGIVEQSLRAWPKG